MSDAQRSRLRAQHIGFVFQDAALDSTLNILDNVIESTFFSGQPRRASRARAAALLDEMGVDVPLSRRPLGLSGGQVQRVAVCRALLPRPAILLADEPTGNLDDFSAAAVLDRFRAEAQRGVTVVISTHDARVTQRCQEVVTL